MGLFAIPGAALGSAKTAHYRDELLEGRPDAGWLEFRVTRGAAFGRSALGFFCGHEEIRLRGEERKYKERRDCEKGVTNGPIF